MFKLGLPNSKLLVDYYQVDHVFDISDEVLVTDFKKCQTILSKPKQLQYDDIEQVKKIGREIYIELKQRLHPIVRTDFKIKEP